MGRADHGPVMDQKCKVQIDEETLHPDLSAEFILGQEALSTCCKFFIMSTEFDKNISD